MEVKKMSFGKYVTSAAMIAVGLGLAYDADAKLKATAVPAAEDAGQMCPAGQKCVEPATTPAPKKKKFVPKGDCTTLFDGNGRCMSENEAKLGGYSRLSIGYCPGKDVCYDTTKPVAEEKKVVEEQPVVQPAVNDDFVQAVYQMQCADEKTELDRLLDAKVAAEGKCKEAENELSDYIVSVLPPASADEKEVAASEALKYNSTQALKEALKANDSRVDSKKVHSLEAAIRKECGEVGKAVARVNEYTAFVKEHGCNYKEPVKVDNFDVTIYAGPSVDTDGNFGGVTGAEVLYHLGGIKLGGYADATLQNQSETESRTNDLGIATEDVKTESELSRYLGGGATASLSLTDWMELQARLGGAWMRSSAEKTITRLGETGTLSSSEHKLAGEAYSGFRFNPYGNLVIDAGAKGNTESDDVTFTLVGGYRF